MDPWQPCSSIGGDSEIATSTTNVVDLVESVRQNGSEKNEQDTSENSIRGEEFKESLKEEELSFGDNFQPFVKLPDSDQYLESLEKKLKIIQKGGRKGPNADSILKSLGQTKESCMIKLLSNSVEKLSVEGELFEELRVNPILKKLAPERQALSAEELVHLLKADQLDILLGNINIEGSEDSSETPTEGEAKSSSTAESGNAVGDGEDISSTSQSQQPSSETLENSQ